jgi:lipopolysaccharide transport system ATP-binding protein
MSCSVLLDNVCNVYQSPVNSNGRMTLRAALRSRPGTPEMREIRAVDGVSLRLREGDQLGIIGRNGAGKSTLLQLIAGLSEPTSGRVAIEGRVHAIMTLGTVLRDEVTGRDNIYLDGAVQSRTRVEIDRILDAVIEFSELGPFIDQNFAARPYRDPESLLPGLSVIEYLMWAPVEWARPGAECVW